MKVAHIVAAAKNGVIGNEGDLPWSIPEDMKWFRERTKGRALIMGRKTFEAVEHPLPNRLNVVVTRQKDYVDMLEGTPEGEAKLHHATAPVVIVSSIEEGLEYCKKQMPKWQNEIFIIGGGEIYRQSVNMVDTIYLTRIHQDFQGDATYPDPDPAIFTLSKQLHRTEPIPFTIETWVRKS
ncbi:MAG: dihydrofolate reductase [Bdellovibrionota bacterium]